jgi:hypothetical protein
VGEKCHAVSNGEGKEVGAELPRVPDDNAACFAIRAEMSWDAPQRRSPYGIVCTQLYQHAHAAYLSAPLLIECVGS